MIDSHCHLDFDAFDDDRNAVLENAKRVGVNEIVIPGTRLATIDKLLTLCRSYPQCKPALGYHPYFLDEFKPDYITRLDKLLAQHRQSVIAVGEIGLDAHIKTDMNIQQNVMESQLLLAKKHDLPVIVHHRKSHHLLLGALSNAKLNRGGVIHAFSGSVQDAERYISLGYKLGVGGIITYPRAHKTRNTLAQVPLDALVLETDAPDMPLLGHQGERNSPEFLPEVAQNLAALRELSVEEVAEQTTLNVREVFSL